MSASTTTDRVYNFSPGPAVLPVPVLEQIQSEMLSLPGCGASILEISHRSKPFLAIMDATKQRLRQLIGIPEDYEILFLQGGSRLQFSMIPMNLLPEKSASADYIVSGSWGKYAYQEAIKEGSVKIVWDAKATNYDRLPAKGEIKYSSDAAYVYFTSNETIQGVQFSAEPETKLEKVPLVCDASSDFLYRPIPIQKYGLLFACAQKNAGPAGVTVVIMRKELLDRSKNSLPGYMNFKNHAAENSLWNTPPTFGIYVMGLVARWLIDDIGGLENMHRRNQEKARLLYDTIDASGGFYRGHAQKDCRSLMNVTFRLPSESLEKEFISQATRRHLDSLAGHRSVGGIRASIYNAMPVEGVESLRDFMLEFRDQHGE